MNENENWRDYKPTIGVWLGSCVGSMILAIIIGFTWGGWVTAGTASESVADASEAARAEMVASVCMDRFINSPDAAAQLAQLKEESRYKRDTFLEEAGWVTLVGFEEPTEGAGELCADQLVEMEIPAANQAAQTADVATPEPAVN